MVTERTGIKKLRIESIEHGMPIIGLDGYAGEQDGTQVITDGVFLIPTRKDAENVYIGKNEHIMWCRYNKYRDMRGWHVSLGHWSDAQHIDISAMNQFDRIA